MFGPPEPAAETRAEAKPMENEVKAQASSPSPLPDPSLSSDLADQLLAPAADMATRSAFQHLNAVALPGMQACAACPQLAGSTNRK